jgi:outer membrane cobalamin receptor
MRREIHRSIVLAGGFAIVLAAASGAQAQEAGPDSLTAVSLRPVVVTVERSAWPLTASTAAVSRLHVDEISRLPNVTLADALRQIPGIAIVDFSGDGTMPQVMARGFYGGGEAEYVVVLLDGKPLNDVQRGLVQWDAIPLTAIERIEVVRGGASALYGDAAIGAVVNVITRDPVTSAAPSWSVAAGSNTTIDASVYAGEDLFGRPVSLFAGLDRTEGFRDHAERTLARAGATYGLSTGETGSLELSALAHWREFEEPGPLLEDDLQADRAASDVFYRFDRTRENAQRIAVEGQRWWGGTRLDASISGDRRGSDAVRTLALAPTFADTKLRELSTARAVGSLQISLADSPLPGVDRIMMGADVSYGDVESDYYAILTGTRNDYLDSGGERGALDASGNGSRSNASAFAEYTLLPMDAVRISLGLRADWLKDEYRATEPEENEVSASHTALSPKAGVNVRWLNTGAQIGHVYLNAGRSFKAPTLDQLFDQRSLPVPFPPFSLTTSNSLLDPQYGTQVEVGLYHSAALEGLGVDASLSAYRIDMRDEIDFDLATLRYVNIARSRHVGLEAGLRLTGSSGVSAFVTAATQSVTRRNGDNHGKQLKAVPKQILNAGISARPLTPVQVGVGVSHTRGIFLDDANTIEHPAFTSLDSRVELSLPGAMSGGRLFVDVRNMLDSHFSTTGYPDPSGSGEDAPIYYFPASGRTLRLGMQVGR